MSTGLESMNGERVRPLRRAEFDRLALLGYFDDERVELLRGVLVEMSPIDPTHDQSVGTLNELLLLQLAGRATLRVQSSYAASDDSEPLPDIVIAPFGEYWTDHPARAHLVIEVARSSLRKDRGLKAEIYAHAGIDEYWIVDLVGEVVEVLRDPVDGAWRARGLARRGETLSSLAFPDVTVAVDRILPPRG